jgi:hypothetical protein
MISTFVLSAGFLHSSFIRFSTPVAVRAARPSAATCSMTIFWSTDRGAPHQRINERSEPLLYDGASRADALYACSARSTRQTAPPNEP